MFFIYTFFFLPVFSVENIIQYKIPGSGTKNQTTIGSTGARGKRKQVRLGGFEPSPPPHDAYIYVKIYTSIAI